MPIKRTVMRSSKGKKLYAVRDAKGRFKDIQSYKKAHAMDIKRKSKAEARQGREGQSQAQGQGQGQTQSQGQSQKNRSSIRSRNVVVPGNDMPRDQ